MVNILDKKTDDKQSAKVSLLLKRQSKIISTKLTSTNELTSKTSETKTCQLESLTTSVNKLIPLFNKIPVINTNNSPTNPVAYKNFVRSKKVIATQQQNK